MVVLINKSDKIKYETLVIKSLTRHNSDNIAEKKEIKFNFHTTINNNSNKLFNMSHYALYIEVIIYYVKNKAIIYLY